MSAPHQSVQVVDRPVQLGFALPGRAAQRASGVMQHCGGLTQGRRGDAGQLTGDPAHRGLGLVTLLLAASSQLGGDRAGPPTRRAAPVAGSGTAPHQRL